jgi:signal transduction histidine kinase/phage shock protein PspC (stress-responsive transcriptional regulator)
VLAGVASGWADRWGVEPTVVRAAVGLLTLVGGIGLLVYAAAALMSTDGEPRPPAPLPRDHRRRELAIGCATGAVLVVCRQVGLWPGDAIMVPAILVAVGISAVWSLEDPPRLALSRLGGRRARVAQVVVGVVLLIAGIASLADRTGGLAGVGASAGAIAVVVGGLAIFFAPALGRLLRRLDEERAARIREDERATMAAHLHDSVLQSLVLMQRTDDPRRITTIARRQERELRAWLYGTKHDGEPTSLHAAIDALAVKIEADHDIRVEAVVVGDQPLDDSSRALVAAIREAVVNAARHAGIDRVDVFVEADDAELTGFVRDTGRGFDPEAVGDDRRGISESIVGRIQRLGGTAVLTSAPGTGTEVELRVPRRRS